MNTNLINQVAVVNTTATASMVVALGKLSVTAGVVTNQGFGETIDWTDILSATYSAYTAAVQPIKRVNFGAAGVTIVANSAVTLRIKAPQGYKVSNLVNAPYEVAITEYTVSPAPTAAALAAQFYTTYLTTYAGTPGLPWTMTYTAGDTFFNITTAFADNNNVRLFQYDSTVTIEGLTASGANITITNVDTNADATFTAANTLSVGDVITISGLVSTTPTVPATNYSDINGKDVVVAAATAANFQVHLNGANYSTAAITYASGGIAVDKLYGVNTYMVQPVGTADMVLRDAPNMYVAGNTYGVITIKRTKHIKGYEGLAGTKTLYDIIYALTGQSFAAPAATNVNSFTAVFTTVAAPAIYLQKGTV